MRLATMAAFGCVAIGLASYLSGGIELQASVASKTAGTKPASGDIIATEAELPASRSTGAGDEAPMSLHVVATELVAQITGAGARSATASQWDVYGADLGHMFWHRDRLYMVFGDTFGEGGLGGSHWRSNTLARLAAPSSGGELRIAAMVSGPDGTAKELIPSRKIAGVEKTVIPTAGISVGERMYLHYMSVRSWGEPGRWQVNFSGFAYSDDDGRSWNTPSTARWAVGAGFEQLALVRQGDYVYSLGIPAGRWGSLRLRRVAADELLNPEAYAYWTGEGWGGDASEATVVVPAPVGEFSVVWSEAHRRWLMLYLNPERESVVLRTAPALTGPWGAERVVATADEYPGLYAPYIVPAAVNEDELYFTMSLWGAYNVFLMRARFDSPQPVLSARNDAG